MAPGFIAAAVGSFCALRWCWTPLRAHTRGTGRACGAASSTAWACLQRGSFPRHSFIRPQVPYGSAQVPRGALRSLAKHNRDRYVSVTGRCRMNADLWLLPRGC